MFMIFILFIFIVCIIFIKAIFKKCAETGLSYYYTHQKYLGIF